MQAKKVKNKVTILNNIIYITIVVQINQLIN